MAEHKDRGTGLLVFGVLQILIGLICGALLLGSAAGWEIAARGRGLASPNALASSVFAWGVAAGYFVTVGIGSIRARRWARALSVAVSGVWLAGGVVGTMATAILYSGSTGAMRFVAVMAVLYVVLPLILFLFYKRLDVGVTCDVRDPERRWTDRVPLSVLALVMVMAFASQWLLVNLSNPVLPLFGAHLTGAPAAIALLALAALTAVIAVQLYRLRESAWWTLVLLQLVGCAAMLMAMTRAEGGAYRDPLIVTLTIATWIGYFAYLVYVRRYFAGRRVGGPQVVAA